MTCKSSSAGRDLPPYEWTPYSILDGLEVTELIGDKGLDAWFATDDFPDTQPMEATS